MWEFAAPITAHLLNPGLAPTWTGIHAVSNSVNAGFVSRCAEPQTYYLNTRVNGDFFGTLWHCWFPLDEVRGVGQMEWISLKARSNGCTNEKYECLCRQWCLVG